MLSRKPNSLNNLPISSFFIPIPVSITYISIIPFFAYETNSKNLLFLNVSSSMVYIFLAIIFIDPPLYVNFKAFETKLRRTY